MKDEDRKLLAEKGEWEEFWKFAYNKWPEHFNGFDWEFDNWLINPARFCELAVGFLKEKKGK